MPCRGKRRAERWPAKFALSTAVALQRRNTYGA
jgi:hypothetical protein